MDVNKRELNKMLILRGWVFVAGLCCQVLLLGQAREDWPRWRGSNADGVADGQRLPTRWSQTENIRWSVKLPGWGTSSPVVYGERVFVTSQVEVDGKKSLLTLCLDRDTGKEL